MDADIFMFIALEAVAVIGLLAVVVTVLLLAGPGPKIKPF